MRVTVDHMGGSHARSKGGERGIALLLAMFALVILGGLAAASFLVAGQQRLLGRNVLRQAQAFTVAETAVEAVVLEWGGAPYIDQSVGASVTAGGRGYGGWYRRTVVRLSPTLFMARAEGFSLDSTSRQHVGLLLTLELVPVTVRAAFTTRGPLTVSASTLIDGTDAVPDVRGDCPPRGAELPAIRSPDPDQIAYEGCDQAGCLRGTPPVLGDSSLTANPFPIAVDLPFDSLKVWAQKVLPGGDIRVEPSTSGSGCNTADLLNWGDPENPLGPCGEYFPVVWIEGSAVLEGGRGQGVLMVNGDFSVRGGFDFRGLVLISGTLHSEGVGGRLTGGVIAANESLGRSTLLGSGGIAYSGCALATALARSARVGAVRSRAWMHLY